MQRFGPPISLSTELFESFNGVFRLCSILSNRQAPSRDISRKFSELDRVKLIMSGGWWKKGGEWVRASNGVLDMAKRHTFIQHNLGWAKKTGVIPSSVKFPPQKAGIVSLPWGRTLAAQGELLLDLSEGPNQISPALHKYIPCPSFYAILGDNVKPEDFVIAQRVSLLQ